MSFIQQWNKAELCGVIVGTGVGRAFSAGGDVASSLAVPRASDSHLLRWSPGIIEHTASDSARPEAVDFFQREYESGTHHIDLH